MHQVLFEDNHLLIVNKRASDIVQGDKTGDTPLSEDLKLYLKEKYHKPGNVFLGVVHRLDRPVSGAIIFARTSKALTRLNAMLQEHTIHKTYWAIVTQKPPREEDHLVHYMVRNPDKNKSFAYSKTRANAKRAELKYRLIGSSQRYYLLEVELLTGRHHQIRAQLAAIGCPITGDLKYGAARSNPDASISLHARYLSFTHPVTQEAMKITAPVPNDTLWKYFEEG
jgi:23S rRNA pseudouridine1911/1915/1917 synthase